MKPDHFLNRKINTYFILFFLMAVVAFWPGYFGQIFGDVDGHFHRHGLSMTLWLMMLILQATLIRKAKFTQHRWVGKASYVIAPLVIITTIDLVHFAFTSIQQFRVESMYAMTLMVNAVVAFSVLYTLGIYFRKNAAVHSRFMVATVFPLFTPVTDRLIYQFFSFLVPWAPTIGRAPIVPFYGFLLADLIILGLLLWDGFGNKRWNVFPWVLVILVTYHISVFTFYQFDWWEMFCLWFVGLPF